MEQRIVDQYERILRELPGHPASRRFCFWDWSWEDYCQLAKLFLECGTPLFVYVMPDVSILIGPPGPPCHLLLR